jgi:hypothetical protein
MTKTLMAAISIVLVPLLSIGAQASFHVKYIASDVVYIDGGSSSGLAEGMKLSVKRPAPGESEAAARIVAELVVVSVASTSAACEVKTDGIQLQSGDLVTLSTEDAQMLEILKSTEGVQGYAQVVSFTEGDPVEEEIRDSVPRPPLPEVNRFSGRISFEHDSIFDRSAGGLRSRQEGVVLRLDMTRIAGSHWNLTGYWRGRLNLRQNAVQQKTLTEVLNRVYHIGLRYENPDSRYVAGFGRLLLPWASSLSTIDGGYFGRRLGSVTTLGIFAGSTPDPTAWNYDPNRQIGGAFANFESGSFDRVRQTSSLGVAVTRVGWRPERQFAFAENGLMFKRYISIQNNVEADYLSQGRFAATRKVAITRSFSTLRIQPVSRLSLDVNHNYFRVLPTFDPLLLATGLVDNLLFQGLSGGVRVELPLRITPYGSLGRSRRNEDSRSSWNTMYGLVLGRIPLIGIRADGRYSRFAGATGSGNYRSVSVVKEVAEVLRLEAQAGEQLFRSPVNAGERSRYVTLNSDFFVGGHLVLGIAGSRYRGAVQRYDQVLANLGIRF